MSITTVDTRNIVPSTTRSSMRKDFLGGKNPKNYKVEQITTSKGKVLYEVYGHYNKVVPVFLGNARLGQNQETKRLQWVFVSYNKLT